MEKLPPATPGEKIGDLIKKAGGKITEEAKAIGISQCTLSDLINDKRSVRSDTLKKICEHYNISADYLLGLTEDSFPLTTDKQKALRCACDLTGLSDIAILMLNAIKDEEVKRFVNGLILHNAGMTIKNLSILPLLIKDNIQQMSELSDYDPEKVQVYTELNGYKYELLFGLVRFTEEYYELRGNNNGEHQKG